MRNRQLSSLSSPQPNSIAPETVASTDPIREVAPKQSPLIRVLAPALKLWLRSQLDAIEQLQITLTGGNRQILSGSIPSVLICANRAIYQGIHLSQIFLQGRGIRFNIAEAIKGQPLHLIDPVPIDATLTLTQADVNASLNAPLFAIAVQDFLESWLHVHTKSWHNLHITLGSDRLIVKGLCRRANDPEPIPPTPAVLHMRLDIRNDHELYLVNPQLQLEGHATIDLETFVWNLGSDVIIEQFHLSSSQLKLQGKITVTP